MTTGRKSIGGREGAEAPARRWIFANVVLDERSLLITISGTVVKLERRPLEALLFLLQHAGELVTKDELLEVVWPGRILSETSLTKCIGRLREVIGDDSQLIIKTVYGYGYRLDVPVRVELLRSEAVPHFNFAAGDHPYGRGLWSLVRRLGAGAHGEAWLCQHDKTREQRVFKFAIDAASLTTLKREITLYRLLKDGLGASARVVDLLDWNLESEPCFIEYRYITGGSLVEWTERKGGLEKIPLKMRLELVARIADALAAVHSLGVLHKDLKPSNILIEEGEGDCPGIRLGDFGSGGVLDPRYLEQLGITRLGFTRSFTEEDAEAGTMLHRAPELMEGQPPTVKADIYALGVILYQVAIGEFFKGFAPGWEGRFEDEVLRECIIDAAQGNPGLRIGDASTLALRLRTIDEERERRRLDRIRQEKADSAERALEAAAISSAVARFLSKDIFAVVGVRPLRDLTVKELLEAASENLADRFSGMPLAAAQIHASLGSAFRSMEEMAQAEKHLDKAIELYESMQGSYSKDAMAASAQLVMVKATLGKFEVLEGYDEILTRAEQELGPLDPSLLSLKHSLATGKFVKGDWPGASEDFRHLVELMGSSPAIEPALLGNAQLYLGFSQSLLGDFEKAQQTLLATQLSLRRTAGPGHPLIASAQELRGVALLNLEHFDEAEAELNRAYEMIRSWTFDDNAALLLSTRMNIGFLRYRQGRVNEAITALEAVVTGVAALNWTQQKDDSAGARTLLARAYCMENRIGEAEEQIRNALRCSDAGVGYQHPVSQHIRIVLADVLRLKHDIPAARAALSSVELDGLKWLGPNHPFLCEFYRTDGLLAQAEGNGERCSRSLHEAQQIALACYGAGSMLTQRIRAETEKADSIFSLSLSA